MTGPLSFAITAEQEALVDVARGFGERRLAAVLQAARAGRRLRPRDVACDGRARALRGRVARRVRRPRTGLHDSGSRPRGPVPVRLQHRPADGDDVAERRRSWPGTAIRTSSRRGCAA